VDQASVWLDIKLIARTIKAIATGRP